MAVITTGAGKLRLGSIHNIISMRAAGGRLVATSWPRHARRKKTIEEQDSVDAFDAAELLIHRTDGRILKQIREDVKGTQWLWRDLLMTFMYGTFFLLHDEKGRAIYPMSISTEVSQALDAVTQTPGAMLYRGPNGWVIITPGTVNNQVLKWNLTLQKPFWG